jgi:hypothetical protein
MSDRGNFSRAIGARVRAMFSDSEARPAWWAARHPADGWRVTSRERGQVPTEARDGARFDMVIGPFNTRRQAHGARLTMRGES